ncbi:testis-expressed protein 47-like isoform X2 [Osmerus eperlanus]|uniref:testis-expressed protein 47-like isoform X2 n=1 Tax=Osmerus eperlanus TaxID=29151 RepID=UPI002E1446F2
MAGNSLPSTLAANVCVNVYYNAYKNSLFADYDKQKSNDKKEFVHRLVYVATTSSQFNSEEKRTTIGEYYDGFLSKFQKNTQTEGVTGVLLLYPKCIIHVLESSADVLTLLLKDLSNMEQNPSSPLQQGRILVTSHMIPSRLFPSWGYRFVTPPLSLQDASLQAEPVETLVPDCLAVIYKLCLRLLKRKDTFPGLDVQEQALVLEEDTVLHLCHSPVLRSPSTYLEVYTKPQHILMDSEIVWPTHRRLCW